MQSFLRAGKLERLLQFLSLEVAKLQTNLERPIVSKLLQKAAQQALKDFFENLLSKKTNTETLN